MTPKKIKMRGYLDSYLTLGFTQTPGNEAHPLCIFCYKTYSNESMKFGKLNEHFYKYHENESDMPMRYFELVRDMALKHFIANPDYENQDTLNHKYKEVSLFISLMIAKCGKPHTIGEELIKPAIACFVSHILKADEKIVENLPLSNTSVQNRIDLMGADVEQQLILKLRTTHFSLQLDESTVRDSDSLLMAYVRYIEKGYFREEMLFCTSLTAGTTSLEVFNVLEKYLSENYIPFSNIISCAADGAPAMMGKNNGCLKLIKDIIPSLLVVHCVIHRENLVAKKLSPQLNIILSSVIKCVNHIKSSAKNERLFKMLCAHMNADHIRLLLHTEVRWLSKGNCLRRFLELYDLLAVFLVDNEHMKILMNIDGKSMLAYLADIFEMMKQLNVQLQGKNTTLLGSKTKIFGFISFLQGCRNNVADRDYSLFTNLKKCAISEYVVAVILDHLDLLIDDFNTRFSDLKAMVFPPWLLQPFLVDVSTIEIVFRHEFYELQNDDSLRCLFQIQGSMMWISDEVYTKYPLSSSIARKLLIPFSSSYLVECGFSCVTDLLTKKRNKLEITSRGDLRLKLTTIRPDIKTIAEGIQYQPSH